MKTRQTSAVRKKRTLVCMANKNLNCVPYPTGKVPEQINVILKKLFTKK